MKKLNFFAFGLIFAGIFSGIYAMNTSSKVYAEEKPAAVISYQDIKKYYGFELPTSEFEFSNDYYLATSNSALTAPLQQVINYAGTDYSFESLITFDSVGISATAEVGEYEINIQMSALAESLINESKILDSNADGEINLYDILHDLNAVSDYAVTLENAKITVVKQPISVSLYNLNKSYLSEMHDFSANKYYTILQNQGVWASDIYYDNSVTEVNETLDLIVVKDKTSKNLEKIDKFSPVGMYDVILDPKSEKNVFVEKNYDLTLIEGKYEIAANPTLEILNYDWLVLNDINYGQTLNEIYDVSSPLWLDVSANCSVAYDANGNPTDYADSNFENVLAYTYWDEIYGGANNSAGDYIPGIYEAAKNGLILGVEIGGVTVEEIAVFGAGNNVADSLNLSENSKKFTFFQKNIEILPNLYVNIGNYDQFLEINNENNFVFINQELTDGETLFLKYNQINISNVALYELVPCYKGVNLATLDSSVQNYAEIIKTLNFDVKCINLNNIFDSVEGINTATDKLSTDLKNINVKVGEITGDLQNLINAEIAGISDEVSNNKIAVATVENYVQNVENTVQTELDALATQLHAIAKTLNDISDPQVKNSLAGLISNNVTNIAKNASGISQINYQIVTLQADIALLAERLYELEAVIGNTDGLNDGETIMSKIKSIESFNTWVGIMLIIALLVVGALVLVKMFGLDKIVKNKIYVHDTDSHSDNQANTKNEINNDNIN